MLFILPLKRRRITPLKLPVFSLVLRPYSFRSTSSSSSSSSSSMPHAIHFKTSSNKEKQLEMNKSDGNATGKHEACVTRRPAQTRLKVDGILKHLGLINNLQRPNATAKATNNTGSSLLVTNNNSSVMEISTKARTSASDVSVLCSKESECPSVTSGCSSQKEGTQQENESPLGANYTRILEENTLPTSFGKRGPSQPKKEKSIKRSLKHGGSTRNTDRNNKSRTPIEVFDICQSEGDESPISNSPIEFLDEVKEPEGDELSEEPVQRMLRPGMILLKNYITFSEQVSIVKKCRELGIGRGGFYRPGYEDGAKLRLHMMCLGLDWDPQTRKYSNRRRIDRSKPPGIPPEFRSLVDRAMEDSYALIRSGLKVYDAEDILPQMNPDICIVNFYSETGRLGLHQDRDESLESLSKGLPVVSVSLGNSAEFLYGDHRDANEAEKLMLESGDVLIFGGESRHVFHGVASIIPDSAPRFLLEKTRLRPGRLNLTFRQY